MPVKGLLSKQQPKQDSMKVMEGYAFLTILILGVLHSSLIFLTNATLYISKPPCLHSIVFNHCTL